MHTLTTVCTLAALLALTWFGPAAFAQDTADYAAKLAQLRAQVESLSEQVEAQRESTRAELRSLASQQTDLDIHVRREALRLAELNNQIELHKTELADELAATQVLVPTLVQAIETLAQQVNQGLPFHTKERLATLDALKTQLQEGTLSPPKCASRLWQFVEDELRLTRENSLGHQVVTIGSETMRVDTAKLGMVSLFFRTDTNRYGLANPHNGGYRFEWLTHPEQQEQLAELFTSLDTQVRVGYFELPYALPEAH